eukprot:582642-Rhodomonas_salina.1
MDYSADDIARVCRPATDVCSAIGLSREGEHRVTVFVPWERRCCLRRSGAGLSWTRTDMETANSISAGHSTPLIPKPPPATNAIK